jgi:ketopantoate reductase
MRHAILGAGGVGGLIGAVLARARRDVALVVRLGTEEGHPHAVTCAGSPTRERATRIAPCEAEALAPVRERVRCYSRSGLATLAKV